MTAFIASISARAWAALAAAGAVLVAIGAIFAQGRRSGIEATRARAAEAEQHARRKGNAAADAAGRAGAADQLRRGRF
jgi:hypothetical protein